jgi:Zn-dependent peptidase ImmA (M78 family)
MIRYDLIRPEVLGARLRTARNARRLTQEAAASAVGMARTTIVAIEAGKRLLDPSELRALAEFYGVSEADLLAADKSTADLDVLFRSVSSASTAQNEIAAASLLNHLVRGTLELEELMKCPPPHVDLPALVFSRDDSIEQQAEDAAMAVRQRLGIGLGPIQDLWSIMELDLGLRVFERPLPSSISGAIAFASGIGGFVLINAKHPHARRRMTGAHEICHAACGKAGVSVLLADEYFDDREDKFCDAFARCLLMPAAAVRKKASELRSLSGGFSVRQVLTMALYFNVSIEGMLRRMEGLGMLPTGTHENLKRQGLGNKDLDAVRKEIGWYQAPPVFTPRALMLAGVAYDAGLVTEQQIASMLKLDLISVREALSSCSNEMGASE